MENNEIIMNEEVYEEEVETRSSGKGLKIAAGVGLAALVGGLAYKFVAKPIAAKIKAKKNTKHNLEYVSNNDDVNETTEY